MRTTIETSEMNSRRLSDSVDESLNFNQAPSPCKRLLEIVTHYDTPKVVRFESKWIASLSLLVKLSLASGCLYLMFQRSSYQIFDRSPISAVTIKVQRSYCSKNSSIMIHFPDYNCSQSRYDVSDFILPATENSAVSITTRMSETEHVLRFCDNTMIGNESNKYSSDYASSIHSCYERPRCIFPPFYRNEYDNKTIIRKTQLCWFKSANETEKRNYQALDYILFVKHFVEFPQLDLVRANLAPDIAKKVNISDCEYDPDDHPLCPKFRILKILRMIENNTDQYERMFHFGSLIEIKISWKCNLDRHIKNCLPHYAFHRLDVTPYENNPFEPGSNFMISKHFFRPNDRQLRRVHTKIYNLHIIVSVTGEVGRFDLFQTTTSIGSFLGIFSAGTIVCDLLAAFFTNFKRAKYDS